MSNIGHNKAPVIAPAEDVLLESLKDQFPEVDTEMDQFEKDFATYPDKLTLEQADVAQALQDLLSKLKGKYLPKLKAYKKEQKGPWDRCAKVVMNFFSTREQKVADLLEKWGPIHEDFLQQKKDDADRKAKEEAERQRKIAEEAEARAREAEEREKKAREDAAAAEERERKAREDAEAAEKREREAKEAAEAAAAEEKRLAKEKADRERAERAQNADNLKQIRQHMKQAEKLHAAAAEAGDDETPDAEVQQLDALIKPGGIVGLLARPVADSTLLDDEQRTEIEAVRKRLDEMRAAVHERLDAKARRKRAREEKEAREREEREADIRRLIREGEERLRLEAQDAREAAEAEAKAAREKKEEAKGEVKEARAAGREAFAEQREAGREAVKSGQEAARAENRADRIDSKNANATDADKSRTRGDYGSVGSLRRRWVHIMPADDTALRATLGPLGGHFTADALNGAVFQWMRAHQSSFTGDRVEPAELPGVVFAYETETQIK